MEPAEEVGGLKWGSERLARPNEQAKEARENNLIIIFGAGEGSRNSSRHETRPA